MKKLIARKRFMRVIDVKFGKKKLTAELES